jgi:hypothetical protein
LETEVLARAAMAGDAEPLPALPSLSTLIRYRARLDRDWRRATQELELLRGDRALPPSPAQLRVVADLIEQGQAATAGGATRKCTNENQVGTNEPTAADRTNRTAHSTDEPRHPVPPLTGPCTDEPDVPPAPPALNRHQRRRLAALARRGLRHAA